MTSVFPMSRTGKICDICGAPHTPQARCSTQDLVTRVTKLLEANRLIPHLMAANKEATDLAETFRVVARDSSRAIFLCEKTVMEFENGTQIWKRFQEVLEKEWPKKPSSPDTEDPQLSLDESTIPNETGSNPSTAETLPGVIIAPDFSQ